MNTQYVVITTHIKKPGATPQIRVYQKPNMTRNTAESLRNTLRNTRPWSGEYYVNTRPIVEMSPDNIEWVDTKDEEPEPSWTPKVSATEKDLVRIDSLKVGNTYILNAAPIGFYQRITAMMPRGRGKVRIESESVSVRDGKILGRSSDLVPVFLAVYRVYVPTQGA